MLRKEVTYSMSWGGISRKVAFACWSKERVMWVPAGGKAQQVHWPRADTVHSRSRGKVRGAEAELGKGD